MNYKDIKEKTVDYLKEIRSETKKVIWPGKNYVTAATIIVFIIVILVIIYVMSIDFCFARFFSSISRRGIF